MKDKRVRWFSITRVFKHKTFGVGLLLGFDRSDMSGAIGVILGFWVLVIGPHIKGGD